MIHCNSRGVVVSECDPSADGIESVFRPGKVNVCFGFKPDKKKISGEVISVRLLFNFSLVEFELIVRTPVSFEKSNSKQLAFKAHTLSCYVTVIFSNSKIKTKRCQTFCLKKICLNIRVLFPNSGKSRKMEQVKMFSHS